AVPVGDLQVVLRLLAAGPALDRRVDPQPAGEPVAVVGGAVDAQPGAVLVVEQDLEDARRGPVVEVTAVPAGRVGGVGREAAGPRGGVLLREPPDENALDHRPAVPLPPPRALAPELEPAGRAVPGDVVEGL